MIKVFLNEQGISLLTVTCTMQMMDKNLPPDQRKDSQSLLKDIEGTPLCLSSVRSMRGYVRASEKVINMM